MNKYDAVRKIEDFAPPETQESWDASGWISETSKREVNKILFALTVTKDVYSQALSLGCDMIISHHPLFFVPLEYKNIDIYCAHTNLDRAKGGTTDTLIKKLGFIPEGEGFVRTVKLENPVSVEDFKAKLVKISPNLRYINNNNVQKIQTIGFCAGSGSEFAETAEADAFVTGDLKFHTALELQKPVFDIGHFESEIFAPQLLKEIAEAGETGVIADEKSPFIY